MRLTLARCCPLLLGLLLAAGAARAGAPPASVKLAAWNLEWLMTPETQRDLRLRCQRGEKRRIPCDVVQGRPRSEADYRAFERHAALLDADVIAIQEVEDARAAARVFPGYAFCLSGRRDWQNVGFAVRRGLPHRCDDDLQDISLKDRVRRGAAMTLFPGTARELRLLSVHLKSGCSRDPLESGASNCRTLASQAPGLGRWIDAQVAAGRAYALLGDFNRDLRADRTSRAGLWAGMADGRPRDEALRDAGDGTPFIACQAGQSFSRYIDYILLGGAAAVWQQAGSFARHPYRDVDAHRFRLSDHCPLSVRLKLR
jgi:endonuclease/exonuclease/phosphatase family metal-dependent hydrolase